MIQLGTTPDEIAARARSIYEREIRPKVEAEHAGEYLIINVATGEFEMDPDDLAASKRAKAKFAGSPMFTMRIGHEAAYRIGSLFLVNKR